MSDRSITSSQPTAHAPSPRTSTLPVRQARLRVAWIGAKPGWLEFEDAAVELEGVELDSLPRDVVRGRGLLGRFAVAPQIMHATRSALGQLPRLRQVLPDGILVLDLTGPGESRLGWRAMRRAASADLILAGFLSELRELRRRYPPLAARTALLRRPIDLAFHAPETALLESRARQLERFRRLYGLDGPSVLFAGPYNEAGGLELVLEAVYELRRRNPEIRLAAIPQGEIDQKYLARCERRALGLGHHGVIQRTPRPEEIPFWYAVANVVSLPCREAVGAETAKLAAAAGRPFVGSEVEPLLEHVVDGETGFLVPRDDLDTLTAALEALIGDDEEARRLGKAARWKAEKDWSPAAAARQLRRLWTDALNGELAGAASDGRR